MSGFRHYFALLFIAWSSGTAMAEGPVPLPSVKLGTHTYVEPTRAEKFEACIRLWEEANHIPKKRWRELCREQEQAK